MVQKTKRIDAIISCNTCIKKAPVPLAVQVVGKYQDALVASNRELAANATFYSALARLKSLMESAQPLPNNVHKWGCNASIRLEGLSRFEAHEIQVIGQNDGLAMGNYAIQKTAKFQGVNQNQNCCKDSVYF